jgi:CheY-like chemotaxis protein
MPGSNLFEGKRILVVEDDYLIVGDLVQDLEALGAEIVGPAPTLEQALEFVRGTGGIDGAILDVNVQGKMVYPLAQELKDRGVPFVFATGYSDGAIPDRYADVPTFSKPVHAENVARGLLGS